MTAQHKRFFLVLSYVLILIGLVASGYGLSLLWQRYSPSQFSELHTIAEASGAVSGYQEVFPVQLYMNEQDIKVPLLKGSVNNGDWKLSEDAALAIPVGSATQSGTVVYGHNYPRILGELNKVKEKDTLELVMSDWSKKRFEVIEVKEVNPEQVQVLLAGAETDLIVYTCSGFLDTKRLVVRASLAE